MVSFAAAYSPAEIESIRAYVIERAQIEKRLESGGHERPVGQ
jgi:hypothetical protein